jgi:hypothetical protein
MPVAPLQEVHEVDAQGLLGLADLPVLTARLAFEVFGERTDPIGERVVGGWTLQEPSYPADAVGRRL